MRIAPKKSPTIPTLKPVKPERCKFCTGKDTYMQHELPMEKGSFPFDQRLEQTVALDICRECGNVLIWTETDEGISFASAELSGVQESYPVMKQGQRISFFLSPGDLPQVGTVLNSADATDRFVDISVPNLKGVLEDGHLMRIAKFWVTPLAEGVAK